MLVAQQQVETSISIVTDDTSTDLDLGPAVVDGIVWKININPAFHIHAAKSHKAAAIDGA